MGKHRLVAEILYAAVRVFDRQAVRERIQGLCSIIFQIIYFLIADFLDVHILGGLDGKAAVVNGFVCLGIRIPLLLHQILHHLLNQRVYKVGIGVFFCIFNIDLLDAGVDVVFQSLLVLAFGDEILILHIFQHQLAALLVLFWVADRVVSGGVFGNPGNDGAF